MQATFDSRKLLLASIHDVSPRFESEIDRLADRFETLLGAPRFAMLVVPPPIPARSGPMRGGWQRPA